MPRKAEGPTPLTPGQRAARLRRRKAAKTDTWRQALERIKEARTVREAREIAAAALGDPDA